MNAVCSPDSLSRNTSAVLIVSSPVFENAYNSFPFSILYEKSYNDPSLAAKTCFNDGVSCFSSAPLMIFDNLAIALATSRSASCFDLLQFS